LLNAICKNPKKRMKGLLKEVGIRDELPTREVTCSRERKQSRA
jgi:hypothetical protein